MFQLILPYIDVQLETFDLSIQSRDYNNDKVTYDALDAIKAYKVALKCSTVTPTHLRKAEFRLKKLWRSPNATLRHSLNGTIFHKPILFKRIPFLLSHWENEIVIARHSHGDQFNSADERTIKAGKLDLTFTPDDGSMGWHKTVHKFTEEEDGGVFMAMYNSEESIRKFAHSCFQYAIDNKLPVKLATKISMLPEYDGRFRIMFQQVYDDHYFGKVEFEHRNIDDMAAQLIKCKGGFLLALKNYDGDIFAEIVAEGFSAHGLMYNKLVGKGGEIVTETNHGTIVRHYKQWQKNNETSSNPTSTIYAWTEALKERGIRDQNPKLKTFSQCMQ